ncbi:MAG: hypothetical protein LBQ79_10660 [Deltaproteobacteria bacterium]|jgi:hypothetical protein|nr:hypothetical protein [Deltaproteobacteria bacterium]
MAEISTTDVCVKGAGERLDDALAIACLVVTATVYLIYILNTDILMTSEQASDILAGVEMLHQKTIFLSDWFYAEELYTIRSPLFIAISALFAGGSFIWSHRISVFIELAFEVFAFVYMLRRLRLNGRTGLLALSLFFGVRSYQSGLLCGMGFSQDASFHTVLFLTIGYLTAGSEGIRRRTEKVLRFVLPVAAFLFGISSAVMLALLYLPLLVQSVWRACVAKDAARLAAGGYASTKGDLLWEIVFWNVLFMAGYLILVNAVADQGHGPVLLTSGDSAGLFYAVAANAPHMLRQFTDGSPLAAVRGSDAFVSLGWYAGISFFVLVVMVLWKTPWAVKNATGPTGGALRSILFCVGSASVLTMVHLEIDRSGVRYIQFMYPYAAILLSFLCVRITEEGRVGLGRLLFRFLAFSILIIGASNIAMLPRMADENPSRAVSRSYAEILGFLIDNGITRVYSLYWDSYTLQVFSSGTVRAAAVDGRMRPFLKNASLNNYGDEATGTRVAFVRTRNPRPWVDPVLEFTDRSAPLLDISAGFVELNDPVNPVRVYVFDGNPFTFVASEERSRGYALEGGDVLPKARMEPGRKMHSDEADGIVDSAVDDFGSLDEARDDTHDSGIADPLDGEHGAEETD